MKNLLLIFSLIVLAACAISREMYLPDGSVGYNIQCDGSANSMSNCFQKAGEICGSNGYILLNREGEAIPYMEGLYHRPQIFESRTIVDDAAARTDFGTVAITTQNIYFSGQGTSFKIPYPDMLIVDPYKNGIMIKREALTGFQAFVTGDGWFTYNLVSNLARWHAIGTNIRLRV